MQKQVCVFNVVHLWSNVSWSLHLSEHTTEANPEIWCHTVFFHIIYCLYFKKNAWMVLCNRHIHVLCSAGIHWHINKFVCHASWSLTGTSVSDNGHNFDLFWFGLMSPAQMIHFIWCVVSWWSPDVTIIVMFLTSEEVMITLCSFLCLRWAVLTFSAVFIHIQGHVSLTGQKSFWAVCSSLYPEILVVLFPSTASRISLVIFFLFLKFSTPCVIYFFSCFFSE